MIKIEPAYTLQKYSIAVLLRESELYAIYLEWVNNFLTVDYFAEYYGFDRESAVFIINKGQELRKTMKQPIIGL